MEPRFFKQVCSLVLAFACLYACKRDKEDRAKTPSFYLAESEKLFVPVPVDLPANPPKGNDRVITLYAEGVQKYKAQQIAGSNPVAYRWAFVAPQAVLYNSYNQNVGTHGAGPFWALSATDTLFAQAFSPAKTAASPNANSIDWLLLMPKANKVPTGVFAGTAYVQRIATTGGKAPVAAPLNAADTTDVPYTAVYRFSRINP